MVCQLSVMFASSPCTSTTGRGWAALGAQVQSFEPGGGVPGCSAAASTFAENVYGTGYRSAAPATPAGAIIASDSAPVNTIQAQVIRVRCRMLVPPVPAPGEPDPGGRTPNRARLRTCGDQRAGRQRTAEVLASRRHRASREDCSAGERVTRCRGCADLELHAVDVPEEERPLGPEL